MDATIIKEVVIILWWLLLAIIIIALSVEVLSSMIMSYQKRQIEKRAIDYAKQLQDKIKKEKTNEK